MLTDSTKKRKIGQKKNKKQLKTNVKIDNMYTLVHIFNNKYPTIDNIKKKNKKIHLCM